MTNTVRTISDLLTNLFQDGQQDKSISAQDVRDLIVSTMLSQHGWQFVLDSQYTDVSPLTLNAGIRTKLTNDGLLFSKKSDATELGLLAGTDVDLEFSPWNSTTNKIESSIADEMLHIQLAVTSHTASPNNFLTADLDVGGTTGSFLGQTKSYVKGTGTENLFIYHWLAFIGADFVSNGADIYVTADSDADLHDIGLTISRNSIPYQ